MPHILFDRGRGQRVPVYLWARDASVETVAQLERIASRPYVVHRVAAMADAHVAEGVAVGTVFATERTLVPRALGGDLGCGVSGHRLSMAVDDVHGDRLERIVRDLGRAIPAGDAIHRGAGVPVPDALRGHALSTRTLERARDTLLEKHLGTLGGGNHFLEIDRDADGDLWLLVHSGSRGLGAAVAGHHVRVAEAADPDPLAGLDAESDSGRAYLGDLAWALDCARANRDALVVAAIAVISDVVGADVYAEQAIDVHHNFVARERWEEQDLWIHRKGAVAVPGGALAIIPGSMATASYLVEGRAGDPESHAHLAFGSCSHGAGRVMTRREARAQIRPAALAQSMRGVAWPRALERKLVEEAPSVYRDIGAVLEDQADLVIRRRRLTPLLVLKG